MPKEATKTKIAKASETIALASSAGTVSWHPPSGTSSTRKRAARRGVEKTRGREDQLMKLRWRFPHFTITDEGKPFRVVKEEVKFGEVDPIWLEFISETDDEVVTWFDHTDYTMFRVNDAAEMKHLNHFNREPRERFAAHEQAMDNGFEAARLVCEPDAKFDMPSMKDLQFVPFKKSKFAGYTYRLKGYLTREEADPLAQLDAEDAWLKLTEGEHVDPDYVRLGGRGKVKEGTNDDHREKGTVAGRLILMLSQRDLKLLGVTEKFATFMAKDPDNPIYVGKSWYYGGVATFINQLKSFTKFFCFDAEKFDSSIDPYLVQRAIAIVRTWFNGGEDEEWDAYWHFVAESLLAAPIMRDDGFCFRKVCGTTSGHSHNTLLQSIITIALGYGVLFAANPNLPVEVVFNNSLVFGLGDDNLIAIRDPVHAATCEDYAQILKDATGISWFGDKSFATTRLVDPLDQFCDLPTGGEFEGVQFLGKYFKLDTVDTDGEEWVTAIPYRPAWESLIKLAVPERQPSRAAQLRHSSYELFYMRALGIFIDGAGNWITRHVCNAVMDWLEARGVSGYLTDADRIMLEMDGFAELEDTSRYMIRRMDYDGWLRLVLADKQEVKKALRYDPYEGTAVEFDERMVLE